MEPQQIMIMGVGCTLLTDEGFGVHAVEKMEETYDFPDNVTLVDGGVTDNLGLRAIFRNLMLSGGALELYSRQKDVARMKHIVVLVVNASTTAVTEIGKSREIPSAIDVLTAVTDIQLHLYNTESNSLLKKELTELVEAIADTTVQPYFIDLNVDDVKDPQDRLYLNQIPTSFSLEQAQVDKVIETAKQLLRQNEDYQRLLTNIGAAGATAGN